jgi:5-methylcytosine-specific restriction endonuclease McrA
MLTSDKLNRSTVLVLNKNWQAVGIKNPADTFAMLMTDTATGLDIRGSDYMVPLRWDEWLELPIEEDDLYVQTVNKKIKIPKVIILSKFDRVPKKRPRFSQKNIWIRDNFTCQYTGKKLRPGEGNIDHVVPKSRGGSTAWENCVLACKQVNAKKADATPEEVGLRLLKKPETPKELPVFHYITNKHNIKEWEIFLAKN